MKYWSFNVIKLTGVVKFPRLSDAQASASNDQHFLDVYELLLVADYTTFYVCFGAWSLLACDGLSGGACDGSFGWTL